MQKQLPLLLVLSLLFAAASSSPQIGGGHDLPAHDAQDTGTEAHATPADVGDPQPTAPASVSQYVHRINVADRGGSCVCIGPGVFVTCKHVFEGLRSFQVSIDGQAVAASVTFAPSHDVAIVRLGSETAAATVETGDAGYLASCTAFGFGSESEHTGTITNNDTLSLSDGEIEQGDSGGGVFCDGKLVGVIRGKNPTNSRVCYFTPLSDVAALVAPFSRGTEPSDPSPGAESKPALTIRVAPFHCPPCEVMRGYDWSGFDVTWETGGTVQRGYPEASWKDSRGTLRWLSGAHTPNQVRWSMEHAQ